MCGKICSEMNSSPRLLQLGKGVWVAIYLPTVITAKLPIIFI